MKQRRHSKTEQIRRGYIAAGRVLIAVSAVVMLWPAGAARGHGEGGPGAARPPTIRPCPTVAEVPDAPPITPPPEGSSSSSSYQVELSHRALDVRRGYVPGVVYQVLVMKTSEDGVDSGSGEVRHFVLKVVTGEDDPSAVNLSLPTSGSFHRCSTVKEHQDDEGSIAVVDGIAGHPSLAEVHQQGYFFQTDWNVPLDNAAPPMSFNFTASVLGHSENWFSSSIQISRRPGCFHYLASSNGTISSGTNPRYNNNVDCITLIQAPPRHTLHLQFERFDLEPYRDDSDLCFDYVSVSASETEVENASRRICGRFSDAQLTKLSFISDGSFLVVKFVTDGKITSSGFSAVFYSLPESGCNMTFTSSTGVLESPTSGNTGRYFPNLDCHYAISAPSSHRIILTFTRFQLQVDENGADVCSDFVRIVMSRNSSEKDTASTNQLVFCGANYETVVTSPLNQLWLHFRSDFRLEGLGFRATYMTYKSCENVTYVSANGTLTSMGYPQPYLHNQFCWVTLHAPPGDNVDDYVIELQFDLLQLHHSNTTSYLQDDACRASPDYIEIDGGDPTGSQQPHRVCGDWRRKLERLHFRSRGPVMIVKFVTDDSGSGFGYLARWVAVRKTATPADCPPGWASHGRACYRLEEAQRKMWSEAQLACEAMNASLASVKSAGVQRFIQKLVEAKQNDSSEVVLWVGANDQQHEADFYWTDGSRVLYTNWFIGWPQHGGYSRQPSDDGLSDEDCVELRSTFAFPSKGFGRTPSLYWNDRSCHVANSYLCQRVVSGGLVPRPVIGAGRGTAVHPGVSSRDCTATLLVDLEHVSGSYTSPGFQSASYDDYTDCSATVQAPPGYVVQLDFLHFHLEQSDNCEYDSLTITSTGHNNQTTSTVVRCGNWNNLLKALRYVSLSNSVHLRFTSDHSNNFKGFMLKYSLVNASQLCPDPTSWSVDHSNTSLCYTLRTEPTDWIQAAHICRMFGGHLALAPDYLRIVTANANADDDDVNSAGRNVWLDATRINNASHWETSTGRILDVDTNMVNTQQEWSNGTCLSASFDRMAVEYNAINCNSIRQFYCIRNIHDKDTILDLGLVEDEGENTNTTRNNTNSPPHSTITSPGFPEQLEYPPNIHIKWRVQASDPAHLLVFNISPLDIEYHPQCLYDFLLISGGPEQRFCGQHASITYSVSGYRATLELVTDYALSGRGFSITWITFPRTSSLNRTIDLVPSSSASSRGVLQSLNYPFGRLNDLSYWVTINAGAGRRVWIELLDLSLLSGGGDQQVLSSSPPGCGRMRQKRSSSSRVLTGWDRLTLYTDCTHTDGGDSVSAATLEEVEKYVLCTPALEEVLNMRYLSRAGCAALHFVTSGAPYISDSSTDSGGRGYRLSYRSVPGELFTYTTTRRLTRSDASGELLNPNAPYTYPPRLDYSVLLQAPLGYLIQLRVAHVELLSSGSNDSSSSLDRGTGCMEEQQDHIDIIDPYGGGEAQSESRLLRRLCGSGINASTSTLWMTSHLHYLTVRFVSLVNQTNNYMEHASTVPGYRILYKVMLDPMFINKSLTVTNVPLGSSCVDLPCENNSTCELVDDSASCQCVPPYTGLTCAWTYCDRLPCQNGGTCHNLFHNATWASTSPTVAGYRCTCAVGYGGATCGIDLHQCRQRRCNKHGICVVRAPKDDTRCVCEYNYIGPGCEVLRGPEMKAGTRLVEEPFWIGIIVVIGLLTLIGFAVLLRRKCLKDVELDCCCCEKSSAASQPDHDKSDKMSVSADNASNYMYGVNDSYQHTPQLSAQPSRSASPIPGYQFDVPTIRINSDEEGNLDGGNAYTISTNGGLDRSHSLDAAAAVFVPTTADIINATSTYNSGGGGYHAQDSELSAIDEESPRSGRFTPMLGTLSAVHTSEEEEEEADGERSSLHSSDGGRVAFIHRDANGATVAASAETTIRRSQSCMDLRDHNVSSSNTGEIPSSQTASTKQLEEVKAMSRRSFRNLPASDAWTKEATTTNFHCWGSMDDDKHSMVKGGKLYEPDDDHRYVRSVPLKKALSPRSPELPHKDADNNRRLLIEHGALANRKSTSAKRREQFVSAVRQARIQNPIGHRHLSNSLLSSQSAQYAESSACSCCTQRSTSFDSDHHRCQPTNRHHSMTNLAANGQSHGDKFASYFSQSVDIASDLEPVQCKCRSCCLCDNRGSQHDSDIDSRRRHRHCHRRSRHSINQRNNHSSSSLNEIDGGMTSDQRRSTHESYSRRVSRRKVESWSISVDIPDGDREDDLIFEGDRRLRGQTSSGRLNRSAVHMKNHRHREGEAVVSADGEHRLHHHSNSLTRRQTHRRCSSERQHHHRSSHSLNEVYNTGPCASKSANNSLVENHKRSKKSRSTHSLSDYHRRHHKRKGSRRSSSDRAHLNESHSSQRKVREHKALTATLSDTTGSGSRKQSNSRRKSSNSFHERPSSQKTAVAHKARSESLSSQEIRSRRPVNTIDSSGSENRRKGRHSSSTRRTVRSSTPDSTDYRFLSISSQDADSARGTLLQNSIDYLKVPSCPESVVLSEPESFGGGTNSEGPSLESGVSSTLHFADDEYDRRDGIGSGSNGGEKNKDQSPVRVRGTTPSGSTLSVDIDTPTKIDITSPRLHLRDDPSSDVSLQHEQHSAPSSGSGSRCGVIVPPAADHVEEDDDGHITEDEYLDGLSLDMVKTPLRDSAYQSKEQSTEKNTMSSRWLSTVASETGQPNADGDEQLAEVYVHGCNHAGFVSHGNYEKRVTNQLELVARKLTALKLTQSDSIQEVDHDEEAYGSNASIPTVKTSGTMQLEGHKFAKERKVWPSRILSIITDEGESELSDCLTAAPAHDTQSSIRGFHHHHHPVFPESGSPKLIRPSPFHHRHHHHHPGGSFSGPSSPGKIATDTLHPSSYSDSNSPRRKVSNMLRAGQQQASFSDPEAKAGAAHSNNQNGVSYSQRIKRPATGNSNNNGLIPRTARQLTPVYLKDVDLSQWRVVRTSDGMMNHQPANVSDHNNTTYHIGDHSAGTTQLQTGANRFVHTKAIPESSKIINAGTNTYRTPQERADFYSRKNQSAYDTYGSTSGSVGTYEFLPNSPICNIKPGTGTANGVEADSNGGQYLNAEGKVVPGAASPTDIELKYIAGCDNRNVLNLPPLGNFRIDLISEV